MPVVFIHGVNVRDGQEYRRDLAARNELIHRLLLEPLATSDPRYGQMEIVSPY